MTAERYQNSGLLLLTPSTDSRRRTLVVMGLARSGTSMIAGCLHELGIFMGDQAPPPVYEDMAMSAAVEAGDIATVQRIVRQYNRQHAIWGWKRPASLHHIADLHATLRDPHYVVVFRDLFAIANRNRISMGANLLANMQRSADEYRQLLNFLERLRAPCLLVSYEKALRHKEAFVDTLCGFAGLQPPAPVRARAVAFVAPSPPAYLKASRAGRVIGHIDAVQADQVFGWAARRLQAPDAGPLQVTLEVNGQTVAVTPANAMRPDLVSHGAHPTGEAGFLFRLQGAGLLEAGDEVRVYAGEPREELNGSPWRYVPEASD
ncbi:MAG: sulfotransferase [Sedimenticolaceae bacterium]